jgi:hypothetical protein
MRSQLFLVGAGFNIEANKYVQAQHPLTYLSAQCQHKSAPVWERMPVSCAYPLVGDLRTACFGPDFSSNIAVESLFQSAYSSTDWVPLNRLSEILSAADHYIGACIAKREDTAYSRFFDSFPESNYISFNYDSIIEFHLLSRRLWNPAEGFGVRAETTPSDVVLLGNGTDSATSRIVVHLHGSLCLYPIESYIHADPSGSLPMLSLREYPRFVFDPESLASDFTLYQIPELEHGYMQPVSRFIPPIPQKADSLEQSYYRILLHRSLELVDDAPGMTTIGYSFSPSDSDSYQDMLLWLFKGRKTLTIVGPDAEDISSRLCLEFKSYNPIVRSIPLTFSEWAANGFQGVLS